MKANIRFTLPILGIAFLFSLTAFGQQSNTTSKGEKIVLTVQKDVNATLEDESANIREAKVDSTADFKQFKLDAGLRISENQNKIDEIRTIHLDEDFATKEKYAKKIILLEERNRALEKKVKEADSIQTSEWTLFKKGFNNDMKELDLVFKEAGSKNE